MKQRRIYFFVGTTAEFIKLAPVIKEFRSRKIKFKIITSGQNLINFDELKEFTGPIKADIPLKQKVLKSSLFGFFIWIINTFVEGLISLRREFKGLNKKNSYFIIHGDTITSLIGAVIAKTYGLKLVQIESGLRSYNLLEPLPEEIIRVIITHLADIMFCPNEWSLKNIENISREKINTNQNTLIESCLWALSRKSTKENLKKIGNYYILFMHRQEHIYFNKDWTRNAIEFVINNADKNLTCIFVLHALTSRFLRSEELNMIASTRKNLIFLPKLSYVDYINLMKNAEFIATDSCTNQEEAYYLGKPFLALRNLTERVEGLDNNVVVSKGDNKIMHNFLKSYFKYKRKPVLIKKRPSKIVVDYLISH